MNIHRQTVRKSDILGVRSYPQVIKYMGSKAKIIEYVSDGISSVHSEGYVCDLFAGAGSLAGAIGNSVPFVSNDIQCYSQVIARCYLDRVSENFRSLNPVHLLKLASKHFDTEYSRLPADLEYLPTDSLEGFNRTEALNQSLLSTVENRPYMLFTRCYSGTWWSARQCLWIDAIRRVADELKEAGELTEADFAVYLTALMHAMAYCSQGTGHFAQYRDAKTISSMRDISIYRRKQMDELFLKKLTSLRDWNFENVASGNSFRLTATDYQDCLAEFEGGTIYADPPYAFVHYSRFYHALETLVLYDYPELQIKGGKIVKGRYREERHQSPFSIRSLVPEAFKRLFQGSSASNSNLVLSYSDTGLFALDDLCDLASDTLGSNYSIRTLYLNHQHMTMGRKDDRHREVQEALLIAECRIK